MATSRKTEAGETPTRRSLRDIRGPGLIPSGIWLLACVGGSVRVTEDKDGNEIEQVTLTHEPVAATESVNAAERDATDEHGKSVYDGKRIFTKFWLRNGNDEVQMQRAMLAHGEDLGDLDFPMPFDPSEDEDRKAAYAPVFEALKGRKAFGQVTVNTFTSKQSGEKVSDNNVRSWAPVQA